MKKSNYEIEIHVKDTWDLRKKGLQKQKGRNGRERERERERVSQIEGFSVVLYMCIYIYIYRRLVWFKTLHVFE